MPIGDSYHMMEDGDDDDNDPNLARFRCNQDFKNLWICPMWIIIDVAYVKLSFVKT